MSVKADSTSTTAPYRRWKSPLTADYLSAKSLSFQEFRVHEPTGRIYLLESRPAEEGRCCIMDGTDKQHKDVLPKGYSARTGVHEYGGAAFNVGPGGNIVFADWETKGVYSLLPGSTDCDSLFDADPEIYYADFDIHPVNSALIQRSKKTITRRKLKIVLLLLILHPKRCIQSLLERIFIRIQSSVPREIKYVGCSGTILRCHGRVHCYMLPHGLKDLSAMPGWLQERLARRASASRGGCPMVACSLQVIDQVIISSMSSAQAKRMPGTSICEASRMSTSRVPSGS